MTSGRFCVHGRGASVTILVASFHGLQKLLDPLSNDHGQILNENAFLFRFLNWQAFFLVLAQEIPDLIVVNLDERASNQEFFVGL